MKNFSNISDDICDDPRVLVIDCSKECWTDDENGYGGVDFLPMELADSIVDSGVFPDGIFEKCKAVGADYKYNPEPEIKTKEDIDNFISAVGGLHDAYIEECKELGDGTLYVRLDVTWGCRVELWFWGDVRYDTYGKDPEVCDDPSWYCSTVFFENGYVYLVDNYMNNSISIGRWNCWFRGRQMKYHIIPY